MNLSRDLQSRLLRAAIIVGVTLSMSWFLWPGMKVVLLTLVPLVVIVLGVLFLPARMAPAARIVSTLAVFGVFLVVRKVLASSALERELLANLVGIGPPLALIESLSLGIGLTWVAGQMVLVVVTDRVRSGVRG